MKRSFQSHAVTAGPNVPFMRAVSFEKVTANHANFQTHNLDNSFADCFKSIVTAL